MRFGEKNLCRLCFMPCEGDVCGNCMNTTQPPGAIRTGAVLNGEYMVGKVLGQGGFGITYIGCSFKTGKRVAIKEFFPRHMVYRNTQQTVVSVSDEKELDAYKNGIEKFIDEAKMLSALSEHPNITDVYKCFIENNTAYYVMEYLDGEDLQHYFKRKGAISETEALRIMRSVCDALEYIHSRNVFHRDISPDNIFRLRSGGIKLIDFGAARQKIVGDSMMLSVILKHGYAPIEQYQANGNQGAWTDIYALGATIYYMITGKRVPDCMTRLREPDLPTAKELHILQPMWNILDKCLKPDPAERYQTAKELKDNINNVLHGSGKKENRDKYKEDNSVDTISIMEKFKHEKRKESQMIKRKKNLIPIIVIIVGAITALMAIYFLGMHPIGRPTPRAEKTQSRAFDRNISWELRI